MSRVMPRAFALGCVVLSLGAAAQQRGAPAPTTDPMATISREYVRLVLALGKHDADYVDAYYGPPELKREAEAANLSLDAIGTGAGALLERVKGVPVPPTTNCRPCGTAISRSSSAR